MALGSSIGCSSGGPGVQDEITFDSYFESFRYEYAPAASLTSLAARSDVATNAVLVGVEDGAAYGDGSLGPPGAHLNLVFATESGNRYYVQLPRSPFSPVEEIAAVLPVGAASIVYLMRNTDPLEGWVGYRSDGNEWFFTTPQGWILDHPERGVIAPLEPIVDIGINPSGDTRALASWLPPGLAKDPGVDRSIVRPATVAEAIERDIGANGEDRSGPTRQQDP